MWWGGHELSSKCVRGCKAVEVIVLSSFHIEVDGGGGDFHVVMPYSMVEPIRELLDAGGGGCW